MSSDQVISELSRNVEFLLKRQDLLEQENRIFKEESQELHKRFDRLEPLAQENKDLRQENAELKTAYTGAVEEKADLEAKIAELKAQINSNIRNSSKPPSSNG